MNKIISVVLVLLMLISIVSFANAQSLSSSSSNPQQKKPGSFSQKYASTYWPALSNADTCEAATDFLINVRPGSCTPRVVRSDLLEEQNVPVFCKVDVVKINPLIDVKKLKSVKFTGGSPYVAGVSFHPNREAVYSGSVLNEPLINDAGYVVIVLKRMVERDMPDSVELNLTAVLRYDSEGIIGPGKSSYYLKVMDDDEWEDSYKENSFFKGNGYLRLESIEDTARISVYKDQDSIIKSFNLKKGETSKEFYMPIEGFYCRGSVQIKLEDIKAGVKRVRLDIDGNRQWLIEGEKFFDKKCEVVKIDDESKEVKIKCKGKGSKILKYEGAKEIEDDVIDDNVEYNFEKAKKYAYETHEEYGNAGVRDVWAAKALFELGELADYIGLRDTAEKVFRDVVNFYPSSLQARAAEARAGILDMPSFIYDDKQIRLVEIRTAKEEGSAYFEVESKSYGLIEEGGKFADGKIVLKKLYSDSVDLECESEDGKEEVSADLNEEVECSGKKVKVKEIRYTEMAKVSVIARMPGDYSEADFAVGIGIEKRAIQLSPEKTKEMIENLNKSIERWENIVENLGNLVRVMKGACFATSAVLFIKNFFQNLGGGATARQKVMPMWYEHCENDDKCLMDNSEEINRDVGVYSRNIESINKEIISLQEKEKERKKVADELRTRWGFSQDEYKDASTETLRDLRLYNLVVEQGSSVARADAGVKIDDIGRRLGREVADRENLKRQGDAEAWLKTFKVKYYQQGKSKELVRVVPIPGVFGGETGFYAVVDENSYTSAGDLKDFWIQNVGKDGVPDVNSDRKFTVVMASFKVESPPSILDLKPDESRKLYDKAVQAITIANHNYGEDSFNIDGFEVKVDKAPEFEGKRCTDFMSPSDCKLLFNLCDPVLCPSSRCNLDGAVYVDNVVQSGIIGSIALCLPNFPEVYVPVCLSGIHAGLDVYVDILKSRRDCLQENLDTGRTVGICDELHSIYLCEFFWRNIGPFTDALLLKAFESLNGQGMKGGGEYLTIQDAFKNLDNSINYMKNEYAVNAINAFEARSVGDIGSEFCKVFVSSSVPSGKFFDNLLQPDSPVQFHAWFDEILFTDVTVPSTSHYKVFYHISAGNDQGVNFQVYLKNPPESAYVYIQEMVVVNTGYITKGGYFTETKDLTAPAGYKQLCVRINGKDECGFKKVSTSFALNYLSDKYYENQLEEEVKTKEECISGKPGLSVTGNIQEAAQDMITSDLENKGIVRVCSSTNPGKGVDKGRWKEVGYCDIEDVKCWLDTVSVKKVIENKNIETALGVREKIEESIMPDEEAESIFREVEEKTEEFRVMKTIKNEDVKALIDKLEDVRDRGSVNAIKARAGYYQFIVYERVVRVLHKKLPVTTGDEDEDEDKDEGLTLWDYEGKKVSELEKGMIIIADEGRFEITIVETEPVAIASETKKTIISFNKNLPKLVNALNQRVVEVSANMNVSDFLNLYFKNWRIYVSSSSEGSGKAEDGNGEDSSDELFTIELSLGKHRIKVYDEVTDLYLEEKDGDYLIKVADLGKWQKDEVNVGYIIDGKISFWDDKVNLLDDKLKTIIDLLKEYRFISLEEGFEKKNLTKTFEDVENCEEGLEERRLALEIPDKLCYWEAMSKLYDEKCDNLNEKDISEMFEKKEEYRKLITSDWPNLNTDGDFCVPVIYDCESWKKVYPVNSDAAGFFNPKSDKNDANYPSISGDINGEIQINPYKKLSKDVVLNTILLHEGLHSIQDKLFFSSTQEVDTHLGEGESYTGLWEQYSFAGDLSNKIKVLDVWQNMEAHFNVLFEKTNQIQEELFSELDKEDEEKVNEYERETRIISKVVSYLDWPLYNLIEPEELENLYEDEVKSFLVRHDEFDEEVEEAFNGMLNLNREAYFLTHEYRAKAYIGKKIEVDPRLSEVQRWWLDETSPDCEVIYDKEKAKEVLDEFLAADVDEVYQWSQRDLRLLLYIYKGTEYEDEIYELLITRLPGVVRGGSDSESAFV